MNNLCKITTLSVLSGFSRTFSVSAAHNANYSCKLLVVGGGTGGCSIAAKFARRLKKDSVIVVEPSSAHYYQPLFTLVGAGVTPVAATRRHANSVLPAAAKWVQDSAAVIDPKKNVVKTVEGHVINYEYIVIAVGLKNDYWQVPGLTEALQDKNSNVSTIYAPEYCEKTWADIRSFKGGDAVFTYPNTPIKCPGAPQKIAYMADAYFNKSKVRSRSNIVYNTCLPVIFGVKKYADALLKVVERKGIQVNYRTVLRSIEPLSREAVFYNADDPTKEMTFKYDMLHVTPPMSTPDFLQKSAELVDAGGYLTVDKYTLQHTKYPNVYGLGDCTNTPNSKTAAAIAKQAYVVEHNLLATMSNGEAKHRYDGYGACPLVTEYGRCVLAEFLYDGVPHETMPKCKLLVVGGGAGGCSVAARRARVLSADEIIVLEPSQVHYCQPMFTLVAAGIKQISQSTKPIEEVLPKNVFCLRDEAEDFDPCNNVVYTKCGYKVQYDYMVVGVGLKNDFNKISGLKEALDNPKSRVSTIYSSEYCEKTWCCLQKFRGGQAVFTFPKQVGKCSGAAQKIMYLADDYWRKQKIRDLTNITYNTGGGHIFGVAKYATALGKVASNRDIAVNFYVELTDVTENCAVFRTEEGQTIRFPYNFLHVTPPMSPPECLAKCDELVTEAGYLDVDKHTLQHKRFPNIFGIGDCISTPNSKTAAAVAPQSYVVECNLASVMEGREATEKYDGYGACPILTSYKTGILAESIYDKKPWETFPFDQSKERRLFYKLKTQYFPYLYWNKLVTGKWNGPAGVRRVINPWNK
ncbi:sulfide:quinone oxidoreductase, mitochondrial [Epargyreus clarus]|uniref:sulfide:quinone oxidoreductase, mitochondrial n=1 Tax=Epargyreus clarus TaxID=520877 RepID=UPI003C2BA2BF